MTVPKMSTPFTNCQYFVCPPQFSMTETSLGGYDSTLLEADYFLNNVRLLQTIRLRYKFISCDWSTFLFTTPKCDTLG